MHIIIIPGSKVKHSSLLWLDGLLSRFYRYYDLDLEDTDDAWANELATYFSKQPGITAEVFRWSGGISRRSLRKASNRLVRHIERTAADDVILLGKSLGGVVAGEAAYRLESNVIKKVLYLATPHAPWHHRPVSSVSEINIYSKDDHYLTLANKLLFAGFGRHTLLGTHDVVLAGLSHDGVNHNTKIEYHGNTIALYDLYLKYILDKPLINRRKDIQEKPEKSFLQ